jgi:hypothetical protein
MNEVIERTAWAHYLAGFNRRNRSRLTKLQVFGDAGAQQEGQDLPLAGISLEERGPEAPRLQIMFGGAGPAHPGHLTHVIPNLARLMPRVGRDGRDDAIEFVDENGEASLLIFERRARMGAHA